jgi:FkbM family methyltransferase
MTLRKTVKRWIYGSCPGLAGAFPYFGTKVYFPPGSMSFLAAFDQGIFEAENVHLLTALTRPGTYCLDVGTNIGLMSLPVLKAVPEARVVSFEASPNVLPYLTRTIAASAYSGRWGLVPKAVGASPGKIQFSLSALENSLYDGIKNTLRVMSVRQVEVEMTTIDHWWQESGKPEISVIKCDVEGGELDVFNGARECLKQHKPHVLLEWNCQNLKVYNCEPNALLHFAQELGYDVYALPFLVLVRNSQELMLQMTSTESFLLSPAQVMS